MSSTLIPMIARVALEYGGKTYAPREYFEAQPIHAAVLNYQQKASLLPSGQVLQTRQMEAVIEEPEILPEPEPEPIPAKRKRTYTRRDMKAQK